MLSLRKTVAIALLCNVYVLISPVVHAYVPISLVSLALSFYIIAVSAFVSGGLKFNRGIIAQIFFVLLPFIVSGFFWEEPTLVAYPKFLILSIIVVSLMDQRTHILFIKYSTFFLYFQCFLAIVGFFYAAMGGGPIAEVTIGWGRTFSLYLTSFSVTNYVGFIRPSGTFDEPGALSFFICFIASLREIYQQNRGSTLVLLVLGFITLSLAHAIFVLIYLVHVAIFLKYWKTLFIVVTLTILAIFMLNSLISENFLFNYVMSRLTSDINGGRGTLLSNAYEIIKSDGILVYIFGIDSNCLTDYIEKCRYVYPAMGENYLSLIAFAGLLPAWTYYFYTVLILVLLFLAPRMALPLFALSVLFWQRPVVFMIGYSFVFAYLMFEITRLFKKRSVDGVL